MKKGLLYASLLVFVCVLISCKNKIVSLEASSDISKKEPSEELVWSDEFDGYALDTLKWSFRTGQHGWGNNEWQNYTDGENVVVTDGVLQIIAKKMGSGQKVGDYTSTRLASKKDFKYGRMEIRAKMPSHRGNGLWPAIWMLGEDIKKIGWPACGEIDIMEYVSFDPNHVIQTIHSTANNHTNGAQISTGELLLETMEETFHNYGIIWKEDQLDFYVDDPENITLTIERPSPNNNDNWPFSKSYYFLLNMAVGGNWGGEKGVDDTIFPATFEIDYVRVYQ